MSFQTCMAYFLLQITKGDILKNVGNQTFWLPSTLYRQKKSLNKNHIAYYVVA